MPDVSDIEINWEFVPYHLVQKDLKLGDTKFVNLNKAYPTFSNLFYSKVLPIPTDNMEEAEKILSDSSFVSLIDTCSFVYKDFEISLEKEFDQAFRLYTYYTGDNKVPNVYTFVSGFAYQNFIFQDGVKDGLGIGLDMYLGDEFPYKSIDPKNPSFSEFLTKYFDKKYIVRKSLLAWLDDKVPTTSTGQLLDIIIRNGKIIYLLDKILPEEKDDVILEFQPSQVEWCLLNEPELWTHLLKNDLVYSDNFQRINKLINPSPSVPGIPTEAPGGVANYIGWRIVQDYMIRSGSSIEALITNTRFQRIFQEAKYRPRVRKK